EAFREFLKGEKDDRLRRLREDAFARFAELGFPTVRLEDWKYTNTSPIANGAWTAPKTPTDLSPGTGKKSVEILGAFNTYRNGLAALNLAFGDMKVLQIDKDTSIDEPIELHLASQENSLKAPHIVIVAEAGSKATIVETYHSTAKSFTNAAVQIVVE